MYPMIRTQAALIALLGVSAVVPLGSPSLRMGLVVTGSFLGALALLFGSCLVTGWIGARRVADPGLTRTLPVADASTRALGKGAASPRLTA
jgi:hypothetical protein